MNRLHTRIGAALATAAVGLLVAQTAWASGIGAARFGGEHGHPTTDNPTSIYYNPAGLALSKGTHIYLDGTMALRLVTYDRPTSAISNTTPFSDQGLNDLSVLANSGKGELFNVIGSPFAAVTSDFGTDFIAAGIGWYYPFGGSAVWDQYSNDSVTSQFPGARDGFARWYSIDGTIRSMYITAAVAFNIKAINLSIGVSGSAIISEVNTVRARNADGSDDVAVEGAGGDPRLKEGRSQVEVDGLQGGFGIGAIWQPLPNELWLGFSYTSQPNVSGGMTLEGKLRNVFADGQPDVSDIEFTQDLPDIFRFGVRYRPVPDWEVRLFGDYTRWSKVTRQCLLDKAEPDRNCDYPNGDTALDNPSTYGGNDPANGVGVGVIQNLARYWKDAFAIRVGVSYWPMPELELYLGAGYDSNAIPDETLDPALTDADKGSIAVGTRWQMHKNYGMGFTFTQLLYQERDNRDAAVNQQFLNPTRQPGNGGVYNQMISVFNLYADISF